MTSILFAWAGVNARADQTAQVVVGNTITISVSADGTQPFTYQWRKDGVNIAGATDATYVIDSATASDVGNYTVVVTNAVGNTTSDVAILTLATVPPSFSTQPAGQAVTVGDNVVFTAVAIGTTPLTYQWRRNGVNLVNGPSVSGVNTTTLTLSSVTAASFGTYTVVATNVAGSVVSSNAVLFVSTPPVNNQAPFFTVNPTPKSAFRGETVTFIGVASALPAATYQWQKDGVNLANGANISGVTFTTLTVANVQPANAGIYTLVATNSIGTATSNAAALTVTTNLPPSFTTQPANQLANTGGVAFFTFSATGYPSPSYQWYKNGVALANGSHYSGVTTNTLSVSSVTSAEIGTYSAVATNSVGSATSDNATLSVNGSPAILSQPQSLTIANTGAVVTLGVTVAGDPAPTLQWRKNGANLANGGIVSGATTTSLTLSGVGVADSGKYSVVVTNTLGTTTSSDFEVSVLASNVWSQSATTGKDVALSAPAVTGSIHWQVSNDSGASWTDLANNATYSGVATNTLHIADVTPALNTALYRLVSVTNGTTTVHHSARLNITAAFVPFPVAVSSDSAGNLYVADAANDTIEKINVSSQITTVAGAAGQTGTADGSGTTARFNDPSGLAAASDGSMVVADKANGTVRLITASGNVSTLSGSTTLRGNVDGPGASATFSSPAGIARDSSGYFYVADAMNHTIRKITPGGAVTTLAGSAGQSGTSDGTGAAARFNNPTAIEVDLTGTLYVADTTNNLIRKITPGGEVTTLAGLAGVSGISDGTGSNALFNQPGGVAVDNAGNVYVADTGSSTVRRITSSGLVSTIAGLPGISGHKDGAGIEAWFNQPRDLTVSISGFLYVADTGNASIRRIDQTGAVTTLALSTPPGTDNPPNQPLPNPPPLPSTPPPLPSTPPLPTLPTSPTPPSSGGGGGGGGGGAPSLWFCGALAALALFRRARAQRS